MSPRFWVLDVYEVDVVPPFLFVSIIRTDCYTDRLHDFLIFIFFYALNDFAYFLKKTYFYFFLPFLYFIASDMKWEGELASVLVAICFIRLM